MIPAAPDGAPVLFPEISMNSSSLQKMSGPKPLRLTGKAGRFKRRDRYTFLAGGVDLGGAQFACR
jgi:hypothetical protein